MKMIVKKQFNIIPELTAQMRSRARGAVRKTVFDIERLVKESMQGTKSGRIYARGTKSHQASASGEAPAIDYGVLVNSLQTEFPSDLTGVLFTNTEYAAALEFGSRRMAERPFMRPAAEEMWPNFLAAMMQIGRG